MNKTKIKREYIGESYFYNLVNAIKDFLKTHYEKLTKKQKETFKKTLDKIWVKYYWNYDNFLPNYEKKEYDDYKSSFILLDKISEEEKNILITIGKTPFPFSRFSQKKLDKNNKYVHNEYYTISYKTLFEQLIFIEIEENQTYNAILNLTYFGIIYFNYILKTLRDVNIREEECPSYYYCGIKIGYYINWGIEPKNKYYIPHEFYNVHDYNPNEIKKFYEDEKDEDEKDEEDNNQIITSPSKETTLNEKEINELTELQESLLSSFTPSDKKKEEEEEALF